jgi:hypothetical protein
MRLFAARDAIVYYEQARRLVSPSTESPRLVVEESAVVSLADLSQLYLPLGWAYELSSQFAQAERIYEELLKLARARQESVIECVALNRLATRAAESSQNLARAEDLIQLTRRIGACARLEEHGSQTQLRDRFSGCYSLRSQLVEGRADKDAQPLIRCANNGSLSRSAVSIHSISSLYHLLSPPAGSLLFASRYI